MLFCNLQSRGEITGFQDTLIKVGHELQGYQFFGAALQLLKEGKV